MRALFLSLLLASFSGLADGNETHPVQCRFLSFGAGSDAGSVLATSDQGAMVTCPLSANELSKPIVCSAKDNAINFISESEKKPVAKVVIPAGIKSALLVFVPAPAKAAAEETQPSAGWRVLVIEDTPKAFPDGGAFVANFYNKDIRFVIGEHRGMLHAAASHGYTMPAKVDEFNMAPVTFELQQGEQWRTASESMLRFVPGIRYLIFAYVDPASGRPRIRTVQDLVGPAPVAVATP